MSDLKPLFELDGRPVMQGQELHIAPSHYWLAGARAKVERFYNDDAVQMRSDNGAVPTMSVSALSWEPHPDTLAMEEIQALGLGRASQRDLAVWSAARAQPAQAGALLTDEEIDAMWVVTPEDPDGNDFVLFARAIESLVRSKLGAGVPMTRQQTDAMFEEVQRRANQLADEGRYTFGGWFPIAVELIEAHHGIVGKEGGK